MCLHKILAKAQINGEMLNYFKHVVELSTMQREWEDYFPYHRKDRIVTRDQMQIRVRWGW